MNRGGSPRVRGLVLALTAVLMLMGFAFWRTVAGKDASRAAKMNEAAEAPAPATPSNGPEVAAAPPAADRNAAVNGAGGSATPASGSTTPGRVPAIPATAPAGALDEAHLMARLRSIKDSDPAATVTMAREGNRRFPDSADAPERSAILVHALVAVDKGSEARGEAEQMVNHYPDSSWVREVEHFTGAHRHRNVSVNDAGQLLFR